MGRGIPPPGIFVLGRLSVEPNVSSGPDVQLLL